MKNLTTHKVLVILLLITILVSVWTSISWRKLAVSLIGGDSMSQGCPFVTIGPH